MTFSLNVARQARVFSRLVLVGLVAVALTATACDRKLLDKKHAGEGGDSGAAIAIKAVAGYKFDKSTVEVEAGKSVTINFENTDATDHDWVVEGVDGAKTKVAGPKKKETISFKAPASPGTYKIICSVPGHAEAGMTAELVVKAGH